MVEINLSLDDIDRAAGRLLGVSHRTPVLTSRTLNQRVDADVYLKAENLQRIGAFKFRGAYNAIASLDPAIRSRGVATFSSGNHAQAVALAASLHETPTVILMPEDAPALKVAATKGYGAEVVTYDRYAEARTPLGETLAEERGMTLIHPYNNWDVVAGQGTVAQELLEETGSLDTLIVCVGGGGLISGCATVAKAQPDPAQVIGVEPETGNDVKLSLAADRIIEIPTPRTIADGSQTTSPGEFAFAVMRERVDEIAPRDRRRDCRRDALCVRTNEDRPGTKRCIGAGRCDGRSHRCQGSARWHHVVRWQYRRRAIQSVAGYQGRLNLADPPGVAIRAGPISQRVDSAENRLQHLDQPFHITVVHVEVCHDSTAAIGE